MNHPYEPLDGGDLRVLRQIFTPLDGNPAFGREFEAEIVYLAATGTYELSWSDLVANEWAETYPTLPLALLRLAVMLELQRDDFRRTFAQPDAASFADQATAWLDTV